MRISSKFFCGVLFIFLAHSVNALLPTPSDIKADEKVVFFNTSAWFDKEASQWHVPIHGWIYEPEESTVRMSVIAKTLKTTLGLEATTETENNFKSRVNILLADNERGKTIVIRFSGRSYVLKASSANGHFKHELIVDDAVIKAALTDSGQNQGKLRFQTVMPEGDVRQFSGVVNLIKPNGLSIISDIDDTIKISQVTSHKALLNNTFFKDFKAVPGMAILYQKWLADGGALHYVSSSPWQLYPALLSFLETAGFPDADFALKDFRFKDSTFLNLFKKSSETKPPQIERILKRYPERQFILVGDSGELDPEIYAEIQQQYPEQIIQIIIRNVTDESLSNPRFKKLLNTTPKKLWQLFDDTETIKGPESGFK